jgi:hypothetical protein
MLLEEPSRAKRILMLLFETKLPRSKDLSLKPDSEEKEFKRKRKSRDGEELLP